MHVSWTSEALNYFNYRSFEGHQYTEIVVWYKENVIGLSWPNTVTIFNII